MMKTTKIEIPESSEPHLRIIVGFYNDMERLKAKLKIAEEALEGALMDLIVHTGSCSDPVKRVRGALDKIREDKE